MKNNRDFEYKFAQNGNGKVVPKDVPLEDGRMVGEQLKLFVYTNKKVVPNEDWEEAVHMEVLKVRRGRSKNKWVKKGEQERGKIWAEDDVCKMKGVSKKTKEKLVRVGIKMVMDLKYLDDSEETMHAVSEASKIDRKRPYH
eukprot:1388508-Ditylum_brightwellii.AAC.1